MTVLQQHPILDPGHPLSSGKSCIRCRKIIPKMSIDCRDSEQFDNGLSLCFFGGYGMFVDTFERSMDELKDLNLCHECAHDLCDFLGIDPRNWHTHDPASGQHSDHHDTMENRSSFLR